MPAVQPSPNSTDVYHDDINSWDGSGAQPNVGTKNEPSKTPTNGYNNSPPTSTALNVASTDDYTNWSWEQILNGVLGLTLPSRNQVTDLRWTLTDSNMDDDHSLFKIFGAAWSRKDFLVYLNPALQDSGGPWDAFYNTPSHQLAAAIAGNTYFPGVLDPRDFASAAAAVQGVQGLYNSAAGAFGQIDQDGNSGAEFQGDAGQAFYQLTSNLNTNAQSIYAQLVPPSTPSYADMIIDSGLNASDFIVGLWNALVGWINQRLDWSPLGAIFQALLDGGVVTNNGGSYGVVNVEQNHTFGNLLTDEGWLAVETQAKNLWNQAVNASLDEVARPLLTSLATSLQNASAAVQPLQVPGMTPVTPGGDLNVPGGDLNVPGGDLNAPGGDALNNLPGGAGAGLDNPALGLGSPGAGDGLNTPAFDMGGPGAGAGTGAGAGLNTPAFDLGGPGAGAGAGLDTPVSALANPGAGLGDAAGAGLDTPVSALANPGAGLGDAAGAGLNTPAFDLGGPGAGAGAGTGLDTPVTALGNPGAGLGADAGLNTPAGDLAGPPALSNVLADNPNTLAAALGTTPAAASALQTALGDSQAEKNQLQKALSLAPSSGPLHNTLEDALAANGKKQDALQSALAGKTQVGDALGTALKDNKAEQTDLQRALAQAPKTGPLHNELASALADSRKTGTALHQAQTAAGIPAEMGRIGGSPAAGLGDLKSLLGDGKGMQAGLGGSAGLPGGLGGVAHVPGGAGASGAAGVNGAGMNPAAAVNGPSSGLTGGTAAAAPGQLTAPQTATSTGAGGVPFFPPMAGGMGMGGAQGQQQERERTTWLAEDEDVWGTDPEVTPHVLGRDFADDEDELDAYEEYAEPEPESRRAPSRARGR